METELVCFESINKFKMTVNYLDKFMMLNTPTPHIHSECEIYFNLSGDVSFMVENSIYPISRGSVIITRPYEYHHCIYNSNIAHSHYWILFSCNGNEKYFDMFFKREVGKNNLIVLNPANTDKLAAILKNFIEFRYSPIEQYTYFFEMMNILNTSRTKLSDSHKISFEITAALNKINTEFSQSISVSELANSMHMSINTLERHFKKQIGITPREYIYQRRISNAASMLAFGSSVIEACEKSGFSDYSHFIALFKKRFGMTPLQYKKHLR